jgi:dTDP-glucose pyrophosphorylase
MQNIEKFLIPSSSSVIEAMSAIDKLATGVAFVCENERMIGVLSDGDIRRYILHGGDLSVGIDGICNRKFKFITANSDLAPKDFLKKHKIRALPMLDDDGRVVAVYLDNDRVVHSTTLLNLPVVIQAGGKGTRLYPYTQVLPKPLIPIGGIPITMHIMQHFADYGCNDFTMIVNHQKNLIKAYFSQDDIPFAVKYVDEDAPLGTGGGLKLLEGKINTAFFLNNCDIIIDADYANIYRHHVEKQHLVTMVCAVKKVTIAYGTVLLDEMGLVKTLAEKPSMSFLTNTGLYLLDPRIFEFIPEDTFNHITDIIQICMDRGEKIGVYPISEDQWSDMGQMSELEKMQSRHEGRENGQ